MGRVREPELWDDVINPALEARHSIRLGHVRNGLLAFARVVDRPISADDARKVAARFGYETGPWCGSVFKTPDWVQVGWKRSEAKGRHGSTIRTYRPRCT